VPQRAATEKSIASVEIRDIYKSFGSVAILQGVSINIVDGAVARHDFGMYIQIGAP
jgi:ABC-type transporter Mla maintaining outer membrane lipid asymmetry ATPase subunit MlaF